MTDRTCLGLFFKESRALSEAEREDLRGRFKSLRRRKYLWGAAAATSPFIFVLALMISFHDSEWIAVVGGIASVAYVAICLLKWGDSRQESAFARDAAAETSVDVFSGKFIDQSLNEPTLRRLSRLGLVRDGRTTLEVLPESGLIHRVDETSVRAVIPVGIGEVAAARTAIAHPEFPRHVAVLAFATQGEYRARKLDADEVEELLRLSSSSRPKWFQWPLLLFICAQALRTVFGRDIIDRGLGILFGMMGIWFVSGLWRTLRFGSALKRDAMTGEVLVVEDIEQVMEILPHSQFVWTLDYRPSDWRHLNAERPQPLRRKRK